MGSTISRFFYNLKLGRKLNIILFSIILLIVIINSLIISTILQNNVEQEIAEKATILIETMSSVRDYTRLQISPELSPVMETSDRFFPQTVPGYSAREVFENLRKRPEYNEFFYKEATLNPTNLRDKADKFETEVVEGFRQNTALKEKTGFRKFPGGEVFYVARPLAVKEQSCLRCHSTPSAAPKNQLTVYGDENGFGWKLNEIVGAQIVSVPASSVLMEAQQLKLNVIGLLCLGFLVAVIVINVFLKQSIVKPLITMSQWAKQMSTGNANTSFEHKSQDEIGILASSLKRLKVSVDMALNMLGQEQTRTSDKQP
jgi:HAMP domain-containing protein